MGLGLEQRGDPRRRAGEPVDDPPRREGAEATARVAHDLAGCPSTQASSSSSRSDGRQRLDPEGRLQREDGDVDPVAVERLDPLLGVVHAEVELERSPRASSARCRRARRRARGRAARRRTRRARGAGGGRPSVTRASPPSATSSTSGSRSGSGSPSPTNGARSRTIACALAVPGARGSARRSHACAARRSSIESTRATERDLLGEPPRRERRHRRAVLDALGLRRRHELERDRLREEPGLGGDRLDGDPELAERALGEPRALAEPFREAGQRRLEELHRPLRRARQDLRERRGARDRAPSRAPATSKLPTETSRPSSTTTSGFDWCALSSRSTCARTKPSASRAAPCSCGRVRKLSGSCSDARVDAAALEQRPKPVERLVEARRRPDGRERRVEQRVAVRAERLEVERARRRRGVVEQLARVVDRERGVARRERVLVEEGDRLARRRRLVPEQADGEVGGLREVRLPDRAERPHRRQVVVVQRADDALGELGPRGRRAPARARSRGAGPRRARRRAGAAGPWAIRCWRSEQRGRDRPR